MKDLSRLTLEERVGQLFLLGFHGHEPDRETRELLQTIRPGGIVFSRRNIDSFEQATRLTFELVNSRDVPSLVAIHQEGGVADQLRQVFAPIPSVSDAARSGMSQLRLLGRIIASELQATGFNTLLGPMLDLSVTGSTLRDRTMAASPAATTRLGAAFIEEVSFHGALVCGKHFPGIGAVMRDPHFALPEIDKSKKLLMLEDIPPFINLFSVLPILMVGHACYPAFAESPSTPASLSPRVVDRLLRRKLGYQGVIMTDDLTLGAITSIGLTADRFLEAIEAGNDMILFSQTTPLVEQAKQTILRAARQSSALRARISASAGRILALKRRIPIPVRNRELVRSRVLRQIERLSRATPVSSR